jgi:hypothetical protein
VGKPPHNRQIVANENQCQLAFRLQLRISSTICAWMETSSALTASSQTNI